MMWDLKHSRIFKNMNLPLLVLWCCFLLTLSTCFDILESKFKVFCCSSPIILSRILDKCHTIIGAVEITNKKFIENRFKNWIITDLVNFQFLSRFVVLPKSIWVTSRQTWSNVFISNLSEGLKKHFSWLPTNYGRQFGRKNNLKHFKR